MPRLVYLLAVASAVSVMAPAAAHAACVTSGDLVCGPGASASAVGDSVVSRSGGVVSERTLATGDRVIGRSDASAVTIGACRVSVPVNSVASIVRSGDRTCVQLANRVSPPRSAPVDKTSGLGDMNLAFVGVGVAAVGGIAAAVAIRGDSKAKSP